MCSDCAQRWVSGLCRGSATFSISASFTIGRPKRDYGPFNQLLTDRVNTGLIEDNWEEVLRLAVSIRHGIVSAALIMCKLAAYPLRTRPLAH